jgi:hypothetical protein
VIQKIKIARSRKNKESINDVSQEDSVFNTNDFVATNADVMKSYVEHEKQWREYFSQK